MSDQAPVEAADPFKGGEPTFTEYSKYREDGTIPERFAASIPVVEKVEEKIEAPAPKSETVEGKEPSETEQEKKERERDDRGKFAKKVEFSPEQQEAFDRAFRKKEAKLRREFEQRYAAQTSVPQATAAEKPETAANAEPKKPELPKLSTYKGTVEEYDKEVADYPAKLQAFLDSQSQYRDRVNTISKRIETSEAQAIKTYPDFKEEVQSLFDDVKNHEEPILPPHVLKAISEEAEDPLGLTYHLAKNREEFRRLAALSPQETLREVLKLDFKLGAAKSLPAPAKTEPTPKPKPPEPVGGRATSSAFDVTDEKMDADDWARQRNKQLAERRNR
jgi:hypothetical protein